MSEHFQKNLAILDTNVVLDCFVFKDSGSAALRQAVETGALTWVATAAMRDELAHVIARGGLDRWDTAAAPRAWAQHAIEVPPVAPCRLVCSDGDDQKFIDLAVERRVRWLVTRDRALLKLARRARTFGVEVLTPQRVAVPLSGGKRAPSVDNLHLHD